MPDEVSEQEKQQQEETTEETRDITIAVRVTPTEFDEFGRAAKAVKRSMSDWIRIVCGEACVDSLGLPITRNTEPEFADDSAPERIKKSLPKHSGKELLRSEVLRRMREGKP